MSYLLLPRRGDVVKWAIVPIGFAVGVLAAGLPSPGQVAEAGAVWLCLELLVYQARYQWNDICGFDTDQRHPGGDRGRLPGPSDRRRVRFAWSASTAAAKVMLALGLCAIAGSRAASAMAVLTAGVFGAAAIYERLRGVGKADSQRPPRPTPRIVAIWVVVGAGYAIRVLAGLWLAGPFEARAMQAAAASAWLFGIAWTTSRWAVESTAFMRLRRGRVRWTAADAEGKEHQVALARWLPEQVPADVRDTRSWRAVRAGTRRWSPWNVGGALAGAMAAVSGVLLVQPAAQAGGLWLALLAGLVASWTLVASGERREVDTAAACAAAIAVAVLAGGSAAVAAVTPWVVVSVAQACYLRQDRASIGMLVSGVRKSVRRLAAKPVLSPAR
ncbi:MAG TPA: hypothetical protein VM093_02050 [Aeromicrobium sp.]|nr:hypothetical protein [Aeromicrobium sp.]